MEILKVHKLKKYKKEYSQSFVFAFIYHHCEKFAIFSFHRIANKHASCKIMK